MAECKKGFLSGQGSHKRRRPPIPRRRISANQPRCDGRGELLGSFEPPLSETPSTKPQAPEKVQILKHQTPKTDAGANGTQIWFLSLELGASSKLGVWNLELVAWALSFSKIGIRQSPGQPGLAGLTQRCGLLALAPCFWAVQDSTAGLRAGFILARQSCAWDCINQTIATPCRRPSPAVFLLSHSACRKQSHDYRLQTQRLEEGRDRRSEG